MSTNRAITFNQAALLCVVEEIFALLELVLDGTTKLLPRILHAAAIRLLCPAESALRRLIVIAAIGLQPKPMRTSHFPKGKKIIRKGSRPLKFQLFDSRKNFDRPIKDKTIQPRIHFFSSAPLVTHVISQPKQPKTSAHICRRFAAFKLALENIPLQAKRLARWQLKRATLKEAKFRFPLRPGAPPGLRRNSDSEIDRILRACHAMAIHPRPEAPS